MEINEIREKLKAAPYFSRDNVAPNVYNGLSKMRTLLCERGEDDPHLLSKGNVTAVWYLTDLTYDGNPQILIRTTIPSGEYEEMLLDKEIFDIIHHDIAYDYDEDVIKGSSKIKGEQEELFTEILEDRIVLVYDREQQGAAAGCRCNCPESTAWMPCIKGQ